MKSLTKAKLSEQNNLLTASFEEHELRTGLTGESKKQKVVQFFCHY